ncbi:MAG: carbon monoxide dehydrogenase subunit G [Pseudomonadota bacterium]
MNLTGTHLIEAKRATIWSALNSPDVLKACIPGCTDMTGSPSEGFSATVTQKVGPVKATFKGLVELSNIVENEGCTIRGEGKGGAAGFAKGGADVHLADTENGTELRYEVHANVGGKLAQLGSRIIDGFAKKMAEQFFERFKAQVEAPGVTHQDGSTESQPAEAQAESRRQN